MELSFVKELKKSADTKIVLLVMDGLGGLPMEDGGLTELETAKTPNFDELAAKSICGLQLPIAAGITPGSGPAHLGLFGYDPVKYQVGRGVLAALGINFDLKPNDVAARGNFCTVDENGNVTDRRAGRIPSEKNEELCAMLREKIDIPGVDVFIETVKEYRTLIVFRGSGLGGDIDDTDPQALGVKPLPPKANSGKAEKTVEYVKEFIRQTKEILKDEQPANMMLLRGFSMLPDIPDMDEVFGVKSAAIAGYPMYRGVSKLVGMNVLESGYKANEVIDTLENAWADYDFFYVHVKKIDSAGEDGDFYKKVHLIEDVDEQLPRVLNLNPDVLIVTGDHSTPAVLKSHSWHPVPTLIYSKYCRPDDVKSFGERACMRGGLGNRIPATELLPVALANALRLEKFGA
jgi:2,3-bisphosphoglycerate-independent phosphoglycerate mutase